MALKEIVAGTAAAVALSGFVLLPPGPVRARDVVLAAPASLTDVRAPSASERLPLDVLPGPTDDPADVDLVGAGDVSAADLLDHWQGVDFDRLVIATRSSLRAQVHLRQAYLKAAKAMPASCRLSPALLAAIGQVESGNLGGRSVGDDHVARPGVFGPPLTGGPYANIPDTDGGRWDGSAAFDRAVGPMQFIPSTWAVSGLDGDGDGVADPQNVYDAAISAAGYLCAGGRDLSTEGGLTAALWSYNRSNEYAAVVRAWYSRFSADGLGALGSFALPVVNAPLTRPSTGGSWSRPANSPTPTVSPSLSTSTSATPAPSSTAPSSSPSASATPDPTTTASPSPSGSASSTPDPCASTSPSPGTDPSPSPSPSPTCSPTPTETPSSSPTGSDTPSPSPTSSETTSPSPSTTTSPVAPVESASTGTTSTSEPTGGSATPTPEASTPPSTDPSTEPTPRPTGPTATP